MTDKSEKIGNNLRIFSWETANSVRRSHQIFVHISEKAELQLCMSMASGYVTPLTFLMMKWMTNLGYPEGIMSTTRFSPITYPTLSPHVGSEMEIACVAKGGNGTPNSVWLDNSAIAVILAMWK